MPSTRPENRQSQLGINLGLSGPEVVYPETPVNEYLFKVDSFLGKCVDEI
jgi:hypothetical protein